MRCRLVSAIAAGLVLAGAGSAYSLVEPEPQPPEQGQLIPGCDVPRQFGRLVTIMPGNNNGLAGQAVFEGEDGTIRWVALMFNSTQTIMQKPALRALPANFPTLPMYECAVGHVWQRP
jgi:hypothetical protein